MIGGALAAEGPPQHVPVAWSAANLRRKHAAAVVTVTAEALAGLVRLRRARN